MQGEVEGVVLAELGVRGFGADGAGDVQGGGGGVEVGAAYVYREG